MAIGVIDDSILADIADAIRSKNSETTQYFPSEMPAAIEAIETGIDTSDATATADNIEGGKTAYVNGEKITGSLNGIFLHEQHGGVNITENSGEIYICYTFGKKGIHNANDTVNLYEPLSTFGSASPSDVVAGKTFTSISGLRSVGTLEIAGKYCWRKYIINKDYEIITEALGSTKPSDCGATLYTNYIVTNDGYFQLSESTYLSGYSIPTNSTNGQTKYIYKVTWSPSATQYSKLTIGDSYTESKGDLVGYVVNDDNNIYPNDGVGQDGYWYTLVADESAEQ